MSEEVSNPYDMHNFEHQKRTVERGKRLNKLIDCVDHFVMSCLRHLIHVFILLGIFGFIGVIFVIVHESTSSGEIDPYEFELAQETNEVANMMSYHPMVFGLNKTVKAIESTGILDSLTQYYDQYWDKDKLIGIHPLYAALQRQSPLNMLLKEPFDLKHHEYHQDNNPLDGKTFYRKYMSKSLPCVLRKEASRDVFYHDLKRAQSKDEIDSTIRKKFLTHVQGGDFPIKVTKISRVFDKHGQIKSQKSEKKSMKYTQFAEERDTLSKSDYSVFIERHQVNGIYRGFNGIMDAANSDNLSEKYQYDPEVNPVKHIMHHILQPTSKLYTQWTDFDDRKAYRLEYEQHVCVYQGTEQFRIVSPIYRKNIYVNVFDHTHDNTTPVDFFNLDLLMYPLAAQFNFLEVTLLPGDCMYVPAYYYVQSRTVGQESKESGAAQRAETVMLVEQYESHSKFIDVMMEALENESLTDKEKNKYENAFDGALQYLNGVK